ncbi:MAG: DUF983 domain-containing protein [Pedobacter sp.]|jgi:uncharacterized protein (DUF983 family)|nr:MAG: DUF983 domain-containing protein [Pedobacter sp.]
MIEKSPLKTAAASPPNNLSPVSKVAAVISSKCPACRKGDIFTGTLYGLNVQRTLEHCSVCGQRYEIEPGYFYAAMYVSYAMNMAEMITTGFLTYILSGGRIDFDFLWVYVGTIVAVSVILSPFNYRYSRVLLLHYLSPKIKYKGQPIK